MSENKIYKKVLLTVKLDADKNKTIATNATFYSYDVRSGLIELHLTKDGSPLTLVNGAEVSVTPVKLDNPTQKMVYHADITNAQNGVAQWEIPEELRGYKGKVRTNVVIDFPNGQAMHGGYFTFNMAISDIDTNIEPLTDNTWQDWNEFQSDAKKEWEEWTKARDNEWDNWNSDFENWKAGEEKKHTQFEEDRQAWEQGQKDKQAEFETIQEKALDHWVGNEEKRRTEVEAEYNDWQVEQESKQSEIENNIESLDEKVDETNQKIDDADFYDKSEADDKLKGKVDNNTFDNLTEHGFLELETGFENYYQDNDRDDKDSTLLQYTRVGNLCHVFGIITNIVRLEEGSSISVAVMPSHLKVISRDVKVSQGSQNNTFTTMILSNDNTNYTNTITMERLRDDNGNDTGYNPGKFLNISLTFTVEVVK